MHDIRVRKPKRETKCRICGPLVCRAEAEGILGHIAFFIYISMISLSIGLMLRYVFPSWDVVLLLPLIGSLRLSEIMFIIATILGGLRIFTIGIRELIEHKEFDVDILVFFAAIGAILIRYFLEAALVVNLFTIADYLETIAVSKAEREIEKLIQYLPNTAKVLRDGREEEVLRELVNVGDLIVVRPGERIPLDGVIVKGEANVDQSIITGESIPVYKTVEDEVFAGTFCLDGRLVIRVTKRAEESLFNRMVNMVLEARERRTDIETFIERFSRYYVPTVLGLAVFTMIGGSLLLGGDPRLWIYKGLILLVLSCPCALAISVPAGMISGVVNAARRGILIKGSKFLEEMSNVKVVAFDKTGTLTRGELVVKEVISMVDTVNQDELLSLIASVEKYSTHPISRAIVEHAEKLGLKLIEVKNFREHPGRGVSGIVDGKLIIVGNSKILEEFSIQLTPKVLSVTKKYDEEGGKVLFACIDNSVAGLLVLADKLKPETKDAIKALKDKGIKTIMLTGDNERVARTIAKEIEIDAYYANLLPDEKVNIVKEISRKYGKVAYAGDGINDAPAIASADVGIAMGMRGIDVTIETADMVLANDNLMNIPYLIDLSKKTVSIVRFNVILSITLKFLLAVLALLGFITLIDAVAFGDDGLALVVVFNSFRLLRYGKPK